MPARRRRMPSRYKKRLQPEALLTLGDVFTEVLQSKEARLSSARKAIANQLWISYRSLYTRIACSPAFLSIKELSTKVTCIVDTMLETITFTKSEKLLEKLAKEYLKLKEDFLKASELLNSPLLSN